MNRKVWKLYKVCTGEGVVFGDMMKSSYREDDGYGWIWMGTQQVEHGKRGQWMMKSGGYRKVWKKINGDNKLKINK